MAGIKGRSGPPHNSNATKYGWRRLWRRGLSRPQDMWVRQPLDLYASALLADKPAPTAGERNVIEIASTCKGCSLLILHELKHHGFTCLIDGVLELTPAARELSRFLSVELKALALLGLERRAKPALSLAEYLNGKPVEVGTKATPTKVRRVKEPEP